MATKKTAAKKATTKKTAAKKTTAKAEPAPCLYCGRDAVAERKDTGAKLCEQHKTRAEARGRETVNL